MLILIKAFSLLTNPFVEQSSFEYTRKNKHKTLLKIRASYIHLNREQIIKTKNL